MRHAPCTALHLMRVCAKANVPAGWPRDTPCSAMQRVGLGWDDSVTCGLWACAARLASAQGFASLFH